VGFDPQKAAATKNTKERGFASMKSMKWGLLGVALTMFAGQAGATLVFIGTIPSTGNGIGAVNTSLTFQNTGTESGCVGFNGTSSTSGPGACPTGFTGGDEKPGASQTNVFTASLLGFTSTNNFSNLVVLFNGNEGGNAGDQSITLNSLGLTLYSATGTALKTFTTTGPNSFAAFPGIGNAGFGFALDATQAAQANALLASNPLLEIGTDANVSNAQGGPETIQLTTVTSTGLSSTVPEPSTTTMLALGLVLIGVSARKRLRSQS
jgi:hypothetical protein